MRCAEIFTRLKLLVLSINLPKQRTRGTLFCALHYKALKRRDLSGVVPSEKEKDGEKNLAGADIGRIVNLMQWVFL